VEAHKIRAGEEDGCSAEESLVTAVGAERGREACGERSTCITLKN